MLSAESLSVKSLSVLKTLRLHSVFLSYDNGGAESGYGGEDHDGGGVTGLSGGSRSGGSGGGSRSGSLGGRSGGLSRSSGGGSSGLGS